MVLDGEDDEALRVFFQQRLLPLAAALLHDFGLKNNRRGSFCNGSVHVVLSEMSLSELKVEFRSNIRGSLVLQLQTS